MTQLFGMNNSRSPTVTGFKGALQPDTELVMFEAIFKKIEAALLGLREPTGARNAIVDTQA